MSRSIIALTIVISLFLFIFFIFSLRDNIQSPVIVVLLLCFIIICAYFFIKKFASVELEIVFPNNGIEIHWKNQFVFHNRADIHLEWPEIKSYLFEPQQYYDLFKVETHSELTIKISHNNDLNHKDDFLKFLLYFERKVNKFNISSEKSVILKKKNIYETDFGIIIAFAMVIYILYVIYMITFKSTKATGCYADHSLSRFFLHLSSVCS